MTDRLLLARRDVLAGGLAAAAAAGLPAAQAQNAELLARPIPHSGEKLPSIGLGTLFVFDARGDQAKLATLSDVVRTLLAGGATLIDTGSTYGSAESTLGSIFAATGLRDKIFLTTKVEARDAPAAGDELKGCLSRLQTKAVDLLQLHNVRSADQSLGMLRDLKAQGFCRYVGVTTTNEGAFEAMEAVIKREKPDFVQINYSLGDRLAASRILPAAADAGAAVLTALPFGRNSLFRAVNGKPVPDWAKDFGATTWGQFFLKYLLADERVTAVIPGTGNSEHVRDNLGAGRGRLPTPAERERMLTVLS